MTEATRKSFLVTGASTGIGRSCVELLVSSGHHVWATVRSDEDEAALSREYAAAIDVLRLDLTDPVSICDAGVRVYAAGALHGIVNNAGVALPGPLEYMPIDVFRRQIEVNLVGQLAMTQAMLPALRLSREQGATARIVMIGSIGGRMAGPMLGPYHASKFGLVGLSDAMRAELAPSGIPVVLIEPGAIATPIWTRGTVAVDDLIERLPAVGRDRYAAQIASARANATRSATAGLDPTRVASVVHRALTARRIKPRYLVGTDAHIAAALARLPHGIRYRLTAARA